jgi:Cu/Ag efflux protein CusF
MKTRILLSACLFALPLTACDDAKQAAPSQNPKIETPLEKSTGGKMDHSSRAMSNAAIGHGTGIIKSLGTQGDFLTIDHGPIEGVGMSAMTMGFDIMGNVDLSTFTEGNVVAFMVKRGRDDSYRITAICNTDTDGGDCLNELMDH